jgi:hypothetical protein
MRLLLLVTLVSMLAFLASCDGGSGGSPVLPVDPVEPVEPVEPEPVLTVAIDDTYGDRFKPAVIDVTYTLEDVAIEWTYETDLRAVRTDTGLLVYGNGDAYEGTVVINDEPFLVQLSSEPRCPRTDTGRVDCLGYEYFGTPEGQIYYGEDDTQVVTWELVILYARTACVIPSDVEGLCDDEINPEDLRRAGEWIVQYNRAMYNSGVFVEFTLKEYRYVDTTSLGVGRALADYLEADISIGKGTTCLGTLGCAYMYNTYTVPGFGWSIGGWTTDLHEMGHSIALGHGPENSSNPGTGSLYPEFGHGWMYNQCNEAGDIMSYNSYSNEFLNSKITCDEKTYVTDRSYADSAYHLNRVRYDVSLVNDEHNIGTIKALRVSPFRPDEGILILD